MDMSSVSGGKSWLMAGAGRMSGDKRRMATFCLQEKDDFIREGKRNKIKKEDLYSLPFFCWCRGPESNRYDSHESRDFKSLASASSATPA